jgi:hypothetical protein
VRSANVHTPSQRSRVVVVAGGAVRKDGEEGQKFTFEIEGIGMWADSQPRTRGARPVGHTQTRRQFSALGRRQLAVTLSESSPGRKKKLREASRQK